MDVGATLLAIADSLHRVVMQQLLLAGNRSRKSIHRNALQLLQLGRMHSTAVLCCQKTQMSGKPLQSHTRAHLKLPFRHDCGSLAHVQDKALLCLAGNRFMTATELIYLI